jgi:phosphopantetheinyl transferase
VLAKTPIEQPSYQTKRASCHYLLQRLLCSISTADSHCWELKYSASGAPALATGENQCLYVSMARSGNWLAAGVAYDAGIGVDIENIKPRTNISEKADFLNWNVPVGDIKDFYAKWTLWEASAKCVEGSVLMRNNQGFDKLCHVNTHDRVGRCGQWSGLHDCLNEKVFYAVVLQCENDTDLSHRILRPEKTEPWSVSNSHQST